MARTIAQEEPLKGELYLAVYNDPRNEGRWIFALPTNESNDSSGLVSLVMGYVTEGISKVVKEGELKTQNVLGTTIMEISGGATPVREVVDSVISTYKEYCLDKLGMQLKTYMLGGYDAR